jgi:hypothetical protein
MPEIWTAKELDASVNSYMQMLGKEKQGIAYNKSEYRSNLQKGILINRTRAPSNIGCKTYPMS